MKHLCFVLAFCSVATSFALGCDSTVTGGGDDPVCVVDGVEYGVGQSIPSQDGCNSCECAADGTVSCTEKVCNTGCQYNGQTYAVGASFPSTDGCNTCTCTADGTVSCTEIACVACTYNGQTYQPGQSFPKGDGCNTCTCAADGTVGCTKIQCP